MNGTEISVKYRNFMSNRGAPTHAAVVPLIDMMPERVAVQFGITHHPAIRTLGFAEPQAFELETREFVAVR